MSVPAAAIPPVTEPSLPAAFRVATTEPETTDTVTLTLEALNGSELAFEPGQFTMVHVFGVGEVPLSISGDPASPEVLAHTVRSVGAVTEAICRLEPGASVGVRGPYGRGWPLQEAEGGDIVIVAGGIGLAPLRPAIVHILANRDQYGRVGIAYGAQTPEGLLYEPDLREWRGHFDLDVEVTVDRSTPGWRGDVGLVTGLLPYVSFDPGKTHALVCGPGIMMRVVARELMSMGVESTDVYLSLERNMKCAVGFCGHCQFGPDFVCRDGPVFSYGHLAARLGVPEL